MSIADNLLRFENEAISFISSKQDSVEFNTVILDDWSGIRLIYETEDVLKCTNNCPRCKTYLAFGEDRNPTGNFLRTTLVMSSTEHTDISRNNMLNCKTMENYMNSFSEWLARRCSTSKDFYDELVLIRSFRVVYSKTCSTKEQTRALEKKMKGRILQDATQKIEPSRRSIFDEMVVKVFGY